MNPAVFGFEDIEPTLSMKWCNSFVTKEPTHCWLISLCKSVAPV
jgi:hypothetical protein